MSKELTFEQANKKLNDIISELEKNDIELDESIKLYEEAYKLLVYCTKKLEESKGRIYEINERIENMKNNGESLFED